MIRVELRNGNYIVNLASDGKITIKSRSGSFNFHSPLDLLCCSLGACVGRHLVQYCQWCDLTTDVFEEIQILMEEHKIEVFIRCYKDLDEIHMATIKNELTNCEVAVLLKDAPKITLIKSDKPMVEKKESTGCCGG